MKNDRKERLLRELERRLGRLSCLAWVTKHRVSDHARTHWTAGKIASYLDERLSVLERWIVPVDAPAFVELSRVLGRIRTRDELRQRLGLRSGISAEWTYGALSLVNHDKPRTLFFACNAWALQFHETSVYERTICLWSAAEATSSMGFWSASVGLLEGRLGLNDAAYTDRVALAGRLQKAIEGLEPDSVAAVVIVLAYALPFLDRSGAAIALLETHLGLSDAYHSDRARLAGHLQEKTKHVTADNAARLIIYLALALYRGGRPQSALALLEARLDLSEAHYADSAALASRLQKATEGLSIYNAACMVDGLAMALKRVGQPQAALELLQAHLGLGDDDCVDSVALIGRFKKATEGLTPNIVASLAAHLADAMRHLGRPATAVVLLENHLGLNAVHYGNPTSLATHLAAVTAGVPPDNAVGVIDALGMVLRQSGQIDAAVALLEARLAVNQTTYDDPAGLVSSLQRSSNGLRADNAANLVNMLADLLNQAGRPGAAVALSGAFLGLGAGNSTDLTAIVGCLNRMAERHAPDTVVSLVVTLASGLRYMGRSEAATALLEARLGVDEGCYVDPPGLANRLRQTTEGLGPNSVANLLTSLAGTLVQSGLPGAAAALLEAHLGLAGVLYTDSGDLVEYLKKATKGLTPNNVANLVDTLCSALDAEGFWGLAVSTLGHQLRPSNASPGALAEYDRSAWKRLGRPQQVKLLIEVAAIQQKTARIAPGANLLKAYFSLFRPFDEPRRPACQNLIPLLDRWFSWFGHEDPCSAQMMAHKVVPLFRRELRGAGMTLDDRARFLEHARNLRVSLCALARDWAENAPNAEEAHQWRLKAQLWDAELGQRVLLERFLLGRIIHAGDDGAREPAVGWPFPGTDAKDATLPDTLQSQVAFDALASEGEAAVWAEMPLAATGQRPAWLRAAERDVAQGLDEATLAQALGPNTLLLRLALSPFDGRLQWAATLSDGGRLEALAHGVGQSGDQTRLAWAVARHDLRVAMAYLPHKAAVDVLHVLRNASFGAGGAFASDRDERLLFEEAQQLAATINRKLNNQSLGNRFLTVCGPLITPGVELAAQWQATVEALSRTAAVPARDREVLNAATLEYLEEIRGVCDLDPLAEHLSPELDVVVQADDVLHATPVAHMPVAGQPLWQRVRSVRASLSVLLDVLQRRIEQERRNDAAENRRVMTISWVRPDDAARPAVLALHQGQRELAGSDRFRIEWRGAAEEPRATLATLLRGVDAGPLRALTVCGHGDEQRAGVRLASAGGTDQLWSGQGRDLSGVEWLLLVSCSVGRVQGSSVRDVEGLCVELALHRCRSVLAAKWPIDSAQAVTVANCVLEEYLELRRLFDEGCFGPDLTDARLRSLVLNRARHILGPGHLNTLAAFEVYGLG